jgi:hypothetical protein
MRERLLAFFDPDRSMALFLVGTAALTVAITVVYDTIKERSGLVGAWILAVCLLAVAMATVMYQLVHRRAVGRVVISEERPEPREGLIVLVSPGPRTAPASIEHHCEPGRLLALWLIASVESLPTARGLADEYRDRVEEIRLGKDYLVDPDQMQDTYAVVERIFQEEAPALGLSAEQVIADITGGMKPMTAGMALACLAQGRDMQYMKALHDKRGDPIRDTPPQAVKIDTTFIFRGARP